MTQAQAEIEYGVRKAEVEKYGEFKVRLERALAVINSLETVCIYAEWEGPDRVAIMGNGQGSEFDFYLISFDGDSLTLPWGFVMIVGAIAEAMVAIMGEDEAIYNKKFLLDHARQMEIERVEREKLLEQTGVLFEAIFFDEESRKAAEERVLAAWSVALGENGWIVSGVQLKNLTRLPILGKDQVLIYHGSARYSPRYYRVYLQDNRVALERIEARNLSGVVEDAEIVPLEELENDELRIVADVLAGMCPTAKKD